MNGLSIHSLVRKVDLFTLKLFLTAIEEGQIGRAAVREHIAASAATRAHPGPRRSRGAQTAGPQPEGRRAECGRRSIRASHPDDARQSRRHASRNRRVPTEGIRGHVAICAPRLIITEFLGNEIGDFTRRFPLAQHRGAGRQQCECGAGGRCRRRRSVSVHREQRVAMRHHRRCRVSVHRLVAVLPPNHPLSSRSSLTLEELLDLDFVAHHTTVITGIRRAAIGIGRELHVKFSVNTVESARSLVRAGLGVTVQPGCMLSVEDHAQLATVPLAGDWAKLSHCIGTLRGRSSTAAAKALIDQLTSHASALTTIRCRIQAQTANAYRRTRLRIEVIACRCRSPAAE